MLDATLTVEPGEAGLALRLTVENTGDGPVSLSFSDGQRAEFVVERPDGGEVWRWSEGRSFTMALGNEELRPGETREFEATWEGAESGEYVVRGWLVAREADAEAEMRVTV
ncbi:BsuPI-related putative proteinase inhibitor [Candidatus Halobonum tyrrellensis]|uniref:Intracellular proteinase inhibitor BsuPI domain-containing protein n=1 Tax=Candidatus Halobonum tyrrellensis G22 TaxID=1324957 RepID=V4HDD4_9EURY|nr:BsuPI-related putative proteinase inhibitor [Candidatus Halobonum tyrrellensis]ESP88078.1 hypothetical protein K933_11029 [Candidatus Halobonum tyrrellensis G22]